MLENHVVLIKLEYFARTFFLIFRYSYFDYLYFEAQLQIVQADIDLQIRAS